MVPQVLTRAEGEAVELTCEVSKSTTQHTHLSVGWYRLQGAGESHVEEVLTLSKDFVLRPGPSYAQRFLVGDVRLNKVGNTTYKFFLGGVQPSDRGQLYCEAAEWIEDPDETWKDISRKQTGRTSLAVMSQGKVTRVGSNSFVCSRLYSNSFQWPLPASAAAQGPIGGSGCLCRALRGADWAQGRGRPWFRSCWCFLLWRFTRPKLLMPAAIGQPHSPRRGVSRESSMCPRQPDSSAALSSSVQKTALLDCLEGLVASKTEGHDSQLPSQCLSHGHRGTRRCAAWL